ncbi:TPA: 50S ribosomal protein L19 [Candidatus Saccharibacteria bacterium]|nr:50S ribosomal protein L19 [Candidatus Saccharibacteria bacterium]HIO87438.1 50S ribosomal protein L19 [Candidatus Saccharibacteria bacterium]
MHSLIQAVEAKHRKAQIPQVKSGDIVRVHQEIVENEKKRTQVFEGLVIRVKRKNSLTSSATVRRIASGVGVEKTFMLNSPSITKIEIVRRSKVRRNYLSYMRERTGKSARLGAIDFDKVAVNEASNDPLVPADEITKEAEEVLSDETPTEELKTETSEENPEAKEDTPKAEATADADKDSN